MAETAAKLSWKGIELDSLRQIMDPPADEAIQSLYDSNNMHHLRDLLINMAENDDMVSHELPKPLHDFVQDELEYEFNEYDIKMFRKTHQIWKDHGMEFCFVLFFRSLPYTYMAEKPANVLRMTKLLVEQPERRVFETAQFVFDVMDEEWWSPHKRGILTTLKIRLMHASMRHVIIHKEGGELWDEARWGKPISQEDLLATNQTFSLEFFKGIEMLGESLDEEEKEAWFHHWKIIGKLLGVEERLLADSIDEAWNLQHKVYDHLFNDLTYAGIGLAKALVETMSHFMLNHKFILLILKRTLADEQFPDCFDRLLAPTYDKVYPEVFHKPQTQEEQDDHDELLRNHFHEHLKDYHKRVGEHRDSVKSKVDKPGFFRHILNWFKKDDPSKPHLIDHHLNIFHGLLHHEGTSNPVEFLEEEMITIAMKSVGGVMVGIMSSYFRKGKKSGFRIPDNIVDHWSLEK